MMRIENNNNNMLTIQQNVFTVQKMAESDDKERKEIAKIAGEKEKDYTRKKRDRQHSRRK